MRVPLEQQEVSPRPAGAERPYLAPVAQSPRRRLPDWAQIALFGLVGAVCAAGLILIALATFGGSYRKQALELQPPPASELADAAEEPGARLTKIEKRLASYAPVRETHVVVDTHRNRLRVYKGGNLLREAICSTGSGVRLRDPRNGREWVFDTPSGEVKVWRKRTNPVWVKPDWAFIEEGYEPPKGMRDRVDDYSLGDYALDMPDGYIIHGTVFKTLLGRRVTHGCIRLGDEDLKFVYETVPVGARVFLF